MTLVAAAPVMRGSDHAFTKQEPVATHHEPVSTAGLSGPLNLASSTLESAGYIGEVLQSLGD